MLVREPSVVQGYEIPPEAFPEPAMNMIEQDDFIGKNLTPTEKELIRKVLINLTRIPDYAPGTYLVQSEDGKYKEEIYALGRIRALSIGYFDHGYDGKIPLTAKLLKADESILPVEDVLEPIVDPVLPGTGLKV